MSLSLRLPIATYRLQLNAGFTFNDVSDQLDYLSALGISDLYLSPIMQARAGSEHGYDVVDPTTVSPALGGREAFEALASAVREREMGILLDIVPNHLAVSDENPWWSAMLRDGSRSREAEIFDVFWDSDDKVVLPILGDHYIEVLRRGEISVEQSKDGQYVLVYFDHRLPISNAAVSVSSLQALLESPDIQSQRTLLDELLANQHYCLSYWRTGIRIVNYRRFFDINDLVALRAENAPGFELVHQPVRELVNDKHVTGLRIDHVDGLRDPANYLERLQTYLRSDACEGNFYVLVEKILSGDEELRSDWQVVGTTGYDFLNIATGALTCSEGLPALIAVTERYAPEVIHFQELVHRAKNEVIDGLFAAELRRLTQWLSRIARKDCHGRDLIDDELSAAIREVTSCLPVYRTYISSPAIRHEDKQLIDQSVEEAVERLPEQQVAIEFLARVLVLTGAEDMDERDLQVRLDFVAAWQQFSGPVMAKGLEDTALYRDSTLLSANTVGGDRDSARVTVNDFHSWAKQRNAKWPHTMNATSTHDSKRSEDVRARIAVLAELPEEWEALVERLYNTSAKSVRLVDRLPMPDGRVALMLFQTILGAWPLNETELPSFMVRVKEYAVKAEREAKLHTSWIEPHAAYEAAIEDYIVDVFQNQQFLGELQPFQQMIAFYGMVNSLSITLLKMTAPGVPDFYQGTEIWDFSLVDPDNRRPVKFEQRAIVLANVLRSTAPEQFLENWQTGAIKLYLIERTLKDRTTSRRLYEVGSYVPLQVVGAHERHILAFGRQYRGDWAITVVPRLTALLTSHKRHERGPTLPIGRDIWGDTSVVLPADAPTTWDSLFTTSPIQSRGPLLHAAEIFESLPVSLLRSTFSV